MTSPPPPQVRIGFDGYLMYQASNGMGALITSIAVFLHGIYAIRKAPNNKIRILIVYMWLGVVIQSFNYFIIENAVSNYKAPPVYVSQIAFTNAVLTQNMPNILLLNIIASAFAGIGDVFGKRLLRAGYVMAVLLFIAQCIAAFGNGSLGTKSLLPYWVMFVVNNVTLMILFCLGLKMLYSQRKLPTVRKILLRFQVYYVFVNMSIYAIMGACLTYVYMIIPAAEFTVYTQNRLSLTLLPCVTTLYAPQMILLNNMFVAWNIFTGDPKEMGKSNNIQVTRTAKESVASIK